MAEQQQLQEITVVDPDQAPHSEITIVDPLPQPPTLQPKTFNLHNPKNRKRHKCSSSCSLCTVILIIVVVLTVALVVGLFLKYTNPEYQIDNVHVKITPTQQYTDYYIITLEAKNHNHRASISYEENGGGSLFFGQTEIARGIYPQFKQRPKSSHVFKMTFHGSNVLPNTIEPTMKIAADTRNSIPLFLSLNVPMKVKVGALKIRSKRINVKCSLTLDTVLSRDAKVLYENCTS